jgi:hypothetical protein
MVLVDSAEAGGQAIGGVKFPGGFGGEFPVVFDLKNKGPAATRRAGIGAKKVSVVDP